MNRREAIQLMIISAIASEVPLLSEPPLPEPATLCVTRLRCESLTNPLGIDISKPRLSWILEAANESQRNLMQLAYQIVVASTPEALARGDGDLWDSGRVASGSSIQIEYGGKPLDSRMRAWWKVRVWDQAGKSSAWSPPAAWSMGLLSPQDWQAKWIGLDGGEGKAEELEGAHWISSSVTGDGLRSFRGVVNISDDNPVSFAAIMIAGSDPIKVSVNGVQLVSEAGHSMHKLLVAVESSTFHAGSNQVVVIIEPGSSQSNPSIIGGVTLDLADGTIIHLRTGNEWMASGLAAKNTSKGNSTGVEWLPIHIAEPPAELALKPIRTKLSARMLRKEFALKAPVLRATAYISGVGVHELYINGQKAGDEVLSPNLSQYDKRVYYRTHDVSGLLVPGPNAIGVLLGNGRYFSLRNYDPLTRSFGYPKMIVQLEIEFHDGTHQTVISDENWKITSDGPIRANNEFDGEEYDARMELDGWNRAAYSDAAWKPVQLVNAPSGRLVAQMNKPIRIMQLINPVKITRPKPGVYVFDMGQNMVGWCQLQVTGAKGTRIRLRHAERLRSDGMLYTDNLRSARATDTYLLRGSGNESYHPRFVYHGFRYVEITGYPGTPDLSTIVGQVVHDALDEHADFTTSNDLLNQIYKNVLWGTRGNYRSIPTDCPQRDERQGWLGDRSSESKGETFMFDVSAFYAKWVTDIEDTMTAAGALDHVAPGYWSFYKDNVTWPATFIIIAAAMHDQYADRRIVQDHYPAMKRWVDYMSKKVKDDLMPYDTYGDWCVPPESLTLIHSTDPLRQTDGEVLGTTYFYYVLGLMSRLAEIAGKSADKLEFDTAAAKMKSAFNAKYFHPATDKYSNGSQTSSILALAFDMVPEDHKSGVVRALVQDIETKTNDHIGTGLIGAQWIMRTLSDNGHPDIAYKIATQRTYPSWGYMIGKGATTIWELWNGDTAAPDMNSMNHLMLVGDLAIWFYENLAGIKVNPVRPGFKDILIHPTVTGDLTSVRASHESPHGKIATSWERGPGRLSLNVSIPVNTTATVYVPTTNSALVKESGRTVNQATGVRFVRMESGEAVYQVGSGHYVFTSTL